jgi:hypothetical protein
VTSSPTTYPRAVLLVLLQHALDAPRDAQGNPADADGLRAELGKIAGVLPGGEVKNDASFAKEFHRPENCDKIADLAGGKELWAGANDWESGWTWAGIHAHDADRDSEPEKWTEIDHADCPHCKGELNAYPGKECMAWSKGRVKKWLRSLHEDATFAFDESKVHRGQPGNKGEFGPGGGAAATSGAQARKKGKRRQVSSDDASAPAKAPLAARVVGALARSGAAVLAAGYGVPREKLAGLIAHVPSAMRAPVGNLWHAVHGVLMAVNTSTKALARQVMKDKGLSEEHIAKLAATLYARDLAFKGGAMMAEIDTAPV